jgi:hypothetical protein
MTAFARLLSERSLRADDRPTLALAYGRRSFQTTDIKLALA